MRERLTAVGGAVLIAAALVIIWLARASVPRDLYVSELGAAGMSTAQWFEWALLLIVVGGSSIAYAARGIRSRPRLLAAWTPAVSLWVACGFFLVASQVPCTAGCPLPVGDTFTWADFVHTLAAVLAFAAACWAMLQCSFAVGRRALARASLVAALAVAVIAGAGGLMSLLRWNANFGSRLELVATTIGLAWILALGLSIAFGQRASAQRASALSGPALHELEQAVGESDELVDGVLVAVDPPAPRL